MSLDVATKSGGGCYCGQDYYLGVVVYCQLGGVVVYYQLGGVVYNELGVVVSVDRIVVVFYFERTTRFLSFVVCLNKAD